jgi:hypothetical protein
MQNQYGLSRDIPAAIKRQVRKACGFGCVVCGGSIIDYEHVDPPYVEAREHDPEKITLLCPQCHAKVTRGFLSKQTVKEAMRDPLCKKRGYASEFLDIGRVHPKVVFAGVTLTNCQVPIEVRGIPLFAVKEAEEAGGPFRLSASFCNSRGESSLQIIDNEWRAFGTNWDVNVVGGAITIRDNPRHTSLRLVAAPPDGVVIEQLDMYLGGLRFLGNPRDLVIEFPDGSRSTFTQSLMDDCGVGLAFG